MRFDSYTSFNILLVIDSFEIEHASDRLYQKDQLAGNGTCLLCVTGYQDNVRLCLWFPSHSAEPAETRRLDRHVRNCQCELELLLQHLRFTLPM